MREYLENEERIEVTRYDEFVEQTGMTYSNLYKLHTDAVAANDRRHVSVMQFPITVQVSAKVLAYLTDQALSNLAVGAELHGHIPDEPTR